MFYTANGHHPNQGHPNPVLKGGSPTGISILPGSHPFTLTLTQMKALSTCLDSHPTLERPLNLNSHLLALASPTLSVIIFLMLLPPPCPCFCPYVFPLRSTSLGSHSHCLSVLPLFFYVNLSSLLIALIYLYMLISAMSFTLYLLLSFPCVSLLVRSFLLITPAHSFSLCQMIMVFLFSAVMLLPFWPVKHHLPHYTHYFLLSQASNGLQSVWRLPGAADANSVCVCNNGGVV